MTPQKFFEFHFDTMVMGLGIMATMVGGVSLYITVGPLHVAFNFSAL